MPVIDFIFLSLTIFSSFLGLSRGFVKEFLSLSKWLLSLYIAFISFEKTKIILSGFLKNTEILDLIAATSIFLITFLILTFIFNFLSKFLSIKGIGFIDKSLGCLFGFLRMILIFSLLFIIYNDVSNLHRLLGLDYVFFVQVTLTKRATDGKFEEKHHKISKISNKTSMRY